MIAGIDVNVYMYVDIIQQGEMALCYYGSKREGGSVHTYLFPAPFAAASVCCVFSVSSILLVFELSSWGLCDFHDTGFDLPQARARVRFESEKSEKCQTPQNAPSPAAARTNVARTLAHKLVSSQLVYCGVLVWLYVRVSEILHHWIFLTLYSSSTHKGGG